MLINKIGKHGSPEMEITSISKSSLGPKMFLSLCQASPSLKRN